MTIYSWAAWGKSDHFPHMSIAGANPATNLTSNAKSGIRPNILSGTKYSMHTAIICISHNGLHFQIGSLIAPSMLNTDFPEMNLPIGHLSSSSSKDISDESSFFTCDNQGRIYDNCSLPPSRSRFVSHFLGNVFFSFFCPTTLPQSSCVWNLPDRVGTQTARRWPFFAFGWPLIASFRLSSSLLPFACLWLIADRRFQSAYCWWRLSASLPLHFFQLRN